MTENVTVGHENVNQATRVGSDLRDQLHCSMNETDWSTRSLNKPL